MAAREQENITTQAKKDPRRAAIENNPCAMCRALNLPLCKGHGGGGSGGSESSDDLKEEIKTTLNGEITSGHTHNQTSSSIKTDNADLLLKPHFGRVHHTSALFEIISDSRFGILIFRGKVGLSKDEIELLRTYFDKIAAVFNEFKEALEKEGTSTKDFVATPKENELFIKIPNSKCYAAFIQLLESKKLLPSFNVNPQEINETPNQQTPSYPSPFNLSPFDISKGPTYK